MKSFKIIFLAMSLFTLGIAISSCGNKSHEGHNMTEHAGKEHTSAYVCPMHCEGSGSDQAGTCPVCGMDYQKNADHKADGHKHEEHSGKDHDGHSH